VYQACAGTLNVNRKRKRSPDGAAPAEQFGPDGAGPPEVECGVTELIADGGRRAVRSPARS